jgi:hypothetical protein
MRTLLFALLWAHAFSAYAAGTDTLRWRVPYSDFISANMPYYHKAIKQDSAFYVWTFDMHNRIIEEGQFADTTLHNRVNLHITSTFDNDTTNVCKKFYAQYIDNAKHGAAYAVNTSGDTTAKYMYSMGKLIEDSTKRSAQQIFRMVEVAPEYKNGRKALEAYVLQNIKVSKRLKKKYLDGTIRLELKVSYAGELQDVTLLRSLEPKVDSALVDVIKGSGPWKPGRSIGIPRSYMCIQALTFE